jgi:hypothetical protein
MNPKNMPHILCILAAALLTSCNGGSQSLIIQPQDCSLPILGQIGLTLNGEIDPNSQVTWQATLGSVVKNAQGLSATYIAPSVPGEAIITATVTSGINASNTVLDVTCQITDGNTTAPSATKFPTQNPTSSGTETPSIVISEVMGNTCGGIEERRYNQYIELYNYGDQPVDVGGWRIYDEGSSGTPDELTAWSSRVNIQFDPGLVMNTTLIPPKGIALVLSPQYHLNPMQTSYAIPAGTIILTVAQSDTLGDDYFGIIADQPGYDTIILYIGGSTIIETKVDTYGTPLIKSSYPIDIDDDHLDNIPMYLSECTSVERINPWERDMESNWRPVTNGSPGEVPF